MDVQVRWCRLDQVTAYDDGLLSDGLLNDGLLSDGLLSDGEIGRLSSLRQQADRQRFVGVRLLLRAAVSEMARCDPGDVALRQRCGDCGGPHGRPIVSTAAQRGPAVSMAHSGALAIVALAPRPVGIDIEALPDDGTTAPVTRGHDEIDLVTWVRQEAVLKMTGHGVRVDPRLVRVSGPETSPRLISWDGPGRTPALRMADVETAPGYVATVARRGRRHLRVDVRSMPILVPEL